MLCCALTLRIKQNMKSNTEKHQVMCMRENNPNYGCSYGGSKLHIITREETFEQLSEITAHYSVVVKKVNKMSGVIRKQKARGQKTPSCSAMDVLRPWIFYQFCLTTLKACARADK